MNKKAFLFYLSALLLVGISVVVKQKSITRKNQNAAVSFYSSWKNEGKPVMVQKVQKTDLETTFKMTLYLQEENTYIAYVPKATVRHLSPASKVFIHYQSKKVPATIKEASLTLHKDTGMYPVKIFCPEKLGANTEKYLAEATVNKTKNTFLLPYNSINLEKGRFFVWTIKKGRAHKQFVTLKTRSHLGIEASGIKEKDLIVIQGSSFIKENDPVKINYGN
ncbi:MAG: hypothetical protein WC371_02130 [Parachlamydiales bacterium]|jgi:hypothetical protein